MSEKTGWNGRFFEDFEIGDVYRHPLGRTVLSADNTWFTLLTQAPSPIHFDHHYSSQTTWKQPIVNSAFILADTIYSQSEILDLRDSQSRPDVGIVKVTTCGFNQNGLVVIHFKRTMMIFRRGKAPQVPRPNLITS
ncbi:MAG: MaoC family dehydratase [Betaproteobacteria bacterium]|nr:MaoC family dehydratase [Betaproteobacteria bacterium]